MSNPYVIITAKTYMVLDSVFCFLKVIPIILPGLSFQEQLNVSLLPSLYLCISDYYLAK